MQRGDDPPKVKFAASGDCLARMSERLEADGAPDFTVTSVKLEGFDGGFCVRWETESAGFGELTFYHKDGKLLCDNGCMGRKFVLSVLAELVDQATMLDD